MRAILILAVFALLMGLAGWLTINRDSGRTSINIETDKIQQDSGNALDNAERIIESAERAITEDSVTDERSIVADPTRPGQDNVTIEVPVSSESLEPSQINTP